ncbi:MAG: serpin family protein [Thermodesulfobacteriota bacterium]
MHRVLKVALFCPVLLVISCNASRPPGGLSNAGNPGTEKPQVAVEAVNSFAFRMYHQLAKENENLFFAPLSIWSAFAMAMAGARGQTEAQLQQALQLQAGGDQAHAAYAALDKALAEASRSGSTLKTATALWSQKGEPFRDEFLLTCTNNYRSGFKEVDFARQPEAARNEINAWVEDQTNKKIRDLIPAPLDPLTSLVLTSAIWFKGIWQHQFDPKHTEVEPFTCLDGTKTKIPFMHQKAYFGYATADGVQILELPYKHRVLSMVVILPSDTETFRSFEKDLSADRLRKWTQLTHETEVGVYFPRFRIQSGRYDLKPPLENMGARDAFQPKAADFSGMNGARTLWIGSAVHKAFVDVNEEGTEAAGASAVIMTRSAALEFRADRPFVFLIRHIPTGCILFVGRFVKPQG